ncbi:MAG: hypothetical protein RL148_347 [Planctomycetota bacterium]
MSSMRLHACLVPLLAVASLHAQADRYELGLRLRGYERQLARVEDPALRSASYDQLNRAVQAFFSMNPRAVAVAIDAARAALEPAPADTDTRWARSLQLVCSARLVDASVGSVPVTMGAVWPSDDPVPQGAKVVVHVGPAREQRFSLEALPLEAPLDLTDNVPGDHEVTWTVQVGDRVLERRTQGLSVVKDLVARTARLEAAAGEAPPDSLEGRTLRLHLRMLADMQRSRGEETILPGAWLLTEAERLAAAVAASTPAFADAPGGQRWLDVPNGKSGTVVRMFAPEGVPAGERRPVVLALHGAGGSENLFFDGYGDGEVVDQCKARGWFCIAPRGQGFMGGADLPTLVDTLAQSWPIDPSRVVMVGHSMGAAAAVAAAVKSPNRYRAVAPLGGGGTARGTGLGQLPFLVGVGTRDFALQGARSLNARLEALGAPTTLREYPDVEHLAIVQIALPDVFAFFDRSLAAPPKDR